VTQHKKNIKEPLIEGHGTKKVLELLEALNNSSSGRIIYQQVEHILRGSDYAQDKIIRGSLAVAQVLISAYRKSLPKNSLLYLELKLIQKRLYPPITLSELAVLHRYLRNATKLISEVTTFDDDIFNQALSPLLSKDLLNDPVMPISNDEPSTSKEQNTSIEDTKTSMHIEQNIDSIYRNKLSQHNKEILEIQSNLGNKVDATMHQQETFSEKLKSFLDQLEYPDKQENTEHLRYDLMREITNILEEQSSLTQIMQETQSFLQLIGGNIHKLSEELNQVRVLSLTDDLTQLPNRRAFMRRIKDEIYRTKRDETLLTIAIIDLDMFKNINDKYGHAVGDEMLRVYAKDILSVFRRYDMVARYGGEEFVVLLPNTDKEGAEHAFNKVQNKVAETFITNNNEEIKVPTFSAGLAIYYPDEPADSLIKRADNALYKAKNNGRNCIEFNMKYLGKSNTAEEAAKKE